MIEYVWTQHVTWKMKYYGLSKQKVLGAIRRPDRVERGIAGNDTVAVMQAVSPKQVNGKKVWKQEVWVMYIAHKKHAKNASQAPTQDAVKRLRSLLASNETVTLVSAWKYPGISQKSQSLPDDVLQDLQAFQEKA